MKAFLAVASAESITGAAEELNLSKAMVSKQIAWLEDMLSGQLLHRNSRGVSLTALGERYRDRCKLIFDLIEETELQIRQCNNKPEGVLRVTAPTSFGTYHLAPKIANYEKMFPEVCVELTLADRIGDLVEEGFDLAIRLGRLGDSSLIARKLMETELVVCAAPSYLQEKGIPKSPPDLKSHNCLIYKPSTVNDEWVFRNNGKELSQQVTGDFVANTSDALRIAALKGRGLIQMPYYVVDNDLGAGHLLTVLDDYQPDPVPIYAVYPQRKNLSATVRVFIDYLYTSYQPIPEAAQ